MYNQIKFGELYLEPSRNGLSRSSDKNGIGVKVVNMGELFWYPRMQNLEMRRVETSDKENKIFGLEDGDLIFARRSLVAEGAGKCNIIIEVEHPTVFESSIIRVRLNKRIANPLFYYYYFTSQVGFGAIQTLVNEVAASGIRSSDLTKLKVIYPEIKIQNRISDFVNNYDELIEVNNQRIKLLEETARELYKEWFVRMRFPGNQGVKKVKGVPEGWDIEPIGKVIDYYIGGGWGNDEKDKQFSVSGYVIRGTDIPKVRAGTPNQEVYRFHKASNMKSRQLIEGDIVFETAGGSEGQPEVV